MTRYAAIGNGLYVPLGSSARKIRVSQDRPAQPKQGLRAFATGPAIFNWASKVGAATCTVLVRDAFHYRRMEIHTVADHYEGRWV